MKTPLQGTSFIGTSRSDGKEPCGTAVQPGTGTALEPAYLCATPEEVEKATALASAAFPAFSNLPGKKRAEFLRAIATEIEASVEDIVERGQLETALPEPRLRGETARTTGQLRMFAKLLEEGSWVDARIDRAQPDRTPLPKADHRSMLRALGPWRFFAPAISHSHSPWPAATPHPPWQPVAPSSWSHTPRIRGLRKS